MNKLEKLSRVCQDFFTKKADSLSHITGFIKRKRKVTGSSFIKTLVLGNMGDAHCSIESMCSLLHEDSIDITKQGLDFRFSASAVTFMKAMYEECLGLFKSHLQLDCKILQQFNNLSSGWLCCMNWLGLFPSAISLKLMRCFSYFFRKLPS